MGSTTFLSPATTHRGGRNPVKYYYQSDMNFMTPRVGSAARRLQHCQMTLNSYSEIRVKTTGISNILAATRQSTEKLPCDSIVARSRFGLVTCVIHELTDSANLPSVSSQGTVPSTVHQ